MDALEAECARYIASDSSVQVCLARSLAVAVDAHQAPRPLLTTQHHTERSTKEAPGRNFAQGPILNDTVHQPPCAAPALCEPHSTLTGTEADAWTCPTPTCLEPIVLGLSMTLDAFTLMTASPVLGECLMLTPASSFEQLVERAAVSWLVEGAGWALGLRRGDSGGGEHVSPAGLRALSQCPEAYLHALSSGRITVTLSLLVLRVPHFFSCVWRVHPFPSLGRSPGERQDAPLAGNSFDLDNISAIARETNEPRESRAQDTAAARDVPHVSTTRARNKGKPRPHTASSLTPLPRDAFVAVAGASAVRVMGVVFEVFFATRSAESPLPWATLLLLPESNADSLTEALRCGTSDASYVRKLTVDLQQINTVRLREALVVGTLVEVHGALNVSNTLIARDGLPLPSATAASCATATSAGSTSASRPTLMAEYVEATAVYLPFSATAHQRWLGEAMLVASGQDTTAQNPLAPVRPLTTLWSATAGDPPTPLPPMDSLSMRFASHPASGGELDVQDPWTQPDTDAPSLPREAEPANLPREREDALPLPMEELFALVSLRCWEGTRLALGVDEAPLAPPSARGMRHSSGTTSESQDGTETAAVDALLFCTDFFSVSYDTVVALLATLMSAQAPGDENNGASLLLLDEGSPAFFAGVLRLLEESVPQAVLAVDPVATSRSRRAFFLPAYHEASRRPSTGAAGSTHRVAAAKKSPPSRLHGGGGGCGVSPPAQSTRTSSGTETVPPAHAEVIRGGALSHGHRRTLILQQAENMRADTLGLLQRVVASGKGPDPGQQGTHAADTDTDAAETEGGDALLVRRVGGQQVPYRVTRSLVLVVQDGAQLLGKPALFEVAQRTDVVIRPALEARRKMLAVCGCTSDDALQFLLQDRQAEWLALLADAFALPTQETVGAADTALTRAWLYTSPQLTETCGNLLRSYFVAAKAVCGEAVDADMMATLVRLTCHHALLRARLADAYYQRLLDSLDGRGSHSSCSAAHGSAEASEGRDEATRVLNLLRAGPPLTALVDALVAVGLCDATLHFLTGKTLLGECVLEMIAREAAPRDEVDGGEDGSQTCISYGAEDEAREQRRFVNLVRRSTCVEPLEPRHESSPSQRLFSIVDLANDLQRHLASGVNSAAAAATATSGKPFS